MAAPAAALASHLIGRSIARAAAFVTASRDETFYRLIWKAPEKAPCGPGMVQVPWIVLPSGERVPS